MLLLLAFIKDPLKCFRNSGTYFMMNLALSDMLTCIFAPFYLRIILIPRWHSFCAFLAMSSGNASMLSIASISLDRFLMVAHPLKHRYLVKGKSMVLWFAGIWLGGLVIPALRLYFGRKANENFVIYCFDVLVITFSAVMYASAYSRLKKQSENIALESSVESRAHKIRIIKQKQFLTTIIVIGCIAFICIVPSIIFFQVGDSLALSKDSLAFHISIVLFTSIFYANFAVNPLVYILRLPNYRKTFYLLYCKCGKGY